MKTLPRISASSCYSSSSSTSARISRHAPITRCLHSSGPKAAVAHPITASGPPPKSPVPAASQYGEQIERRRRQSELLKQGKELRKQESPKSALKKRFWKDVHVKEVEGGHQVLLDSRPIRSPSKEILIIPASKPHLAHAVALEWDLLVSAQQALKQHLIPLTSIVARAEDIADQDKRGETTTRDEIVKTSMRYLDTDTLLCWAPEKNIHDFTAESEGEDKPETVRDVQIKTAQPIIGFLASKVWPGIELRPVLDTDSILPASQPQVTKDVIRGWISGLPAYELAALERGFLAAKSLLLAVRLVVEWSEHFRHLQNGEERFGIEQAAEAASVEVRWQTGMWGEVEDSHDVEKEDMKRQLGTAILLVSGEGVGK